MKTRNDLIEHFATQAVNHWYSGEPNPFYHIGREMAGAALALDVNDVEFYKDVKARFAAIRHS